MGANVVPLKRRSPLASREQLSCAHTTVAANLDVMQVAGTYAKLVYCMAAWHDRPAGSNFVTNPPTDEAHSIWRQFSLDQFLQRRTGKALDRVRPG